MTEADHQRPAPKRGRPITEPCGTTAAARRHRRAGEDVCGPCKAAVSVANARYYQARKAKRAGDA